MLNIKQIFILPLINPKKTNISIIKNYIFYLVKNCAKIKKSSLVLKKQSVLLQNISLNTIKKYIIVQ